MGTSLLKGRRLVFVSHLDLNLYRFRLPIMRALVQEGAEVWAVSPPGPWATRFAEHGVHFLPWAIDRRTLLPWKGLTATRSLEQVVHQIHPDLIHTFTLRPNLYGGFASRAVPQAKFIASVTGLGNLYIETGWKWRLVRQGVEMAMRRALRGAAAVVFQNRDDLQYYLQARLCTRKQAYLIRGSGVDVQRFSLAAVSPEVTARLAERWGIPSDAFVVLMIARLIRSKGVEEFLQAARALANPQHGIYFVLVGAPDPGNPSSLTSAEVASWQQTPGLILPGFQEEVAPWLSLADVYVLPSYREGLPRTVLEAMAMGLPVITTDAPGCRETVEPGHNGFLIPPRDVQALVKSIEHLRHDGALRRAMAAASRRKAEAEFAVDKVVQQHLRLYQQVLG